MECRWLHLTWVKHNSEMLSCGHSWGCFYSAFCSYIKSTYSVGKLQVKQKVCYAFARILLMNVKPGFSVHLLKQNNVKKQIGSAIVTDIWGKKTSFGILTRDFKKRHIGDIDNMMLCNSEFSQTVVLSLTSLIQLLCTASHLNSACKQQLFSPQLPLNLKASQQQT